MKHAALVLTASTLLIGAAPPMTMAQKFNTPWQLAPGPIMSVVVTHDMKDCEQQVYVRLSVDSPADDPDNGDYLMYCTDDDQKYVAFEVLPGDDKLVGPIALPADVPLPDRRTIPQIPGN